jgi:hypothetical protein
MLHLVESRKNRLLVLYGAGVGVGGEARAAEIPIEKRRRTNSPALKYRGGCTSVWAHIRKLLSE